MPMSASIQSWRIRSGFHSGLLLACLKFPKAGNRAGQSLTGRGVKFLLTVQSSSLCALLCKFLAVPCSSLQFLAVLSSFPFPFSVGLERTAIMLPGRLPFILRTVPTSSQQLMYCGPDGKGYCEEYAYPPGTDYGPPYPPAGEKIYHNFEEYCKFPHLPFPHTVSSQTQALRQTQPLATRPNTLIGPADIGHIQAPYQKTHHIC